MANEGLAEDSKNYTHSSLRESIIEHLFVGKILQALWKKDRFDIEVLKPQVDNAGYDLAIDFSAAQKSNHSTVRHIQLKSSNAEGKRDSVSVSLKLGSKPNWCVIWIAVDKELEFKSFRWFGSDLCQSPFTGEDFKVTKHTKADSTGKKAERPGHRIVPKSRFEKLASIDDVIERLFSRVGH